MKLGAIITEKDPRNLKFLWFGHSLPDPPDEIDWATEMKSRLQMWKNDEYGDCVFAAFYNYLAVATGYTNDTFPYVNEDVLADYTAVTGFDPNDPSTDNGTNPEAALKYYMKNNRILAWGEINHHSMKECKQALDILTLGFGSGQKQRDKDDHELVQELYQISWLPFAVLSSAQPEALSLRVSS